MSYTNEQFEKQKEYIGKEMESYSSEQKQSVIGQLKYNWPTDNELQEFVTKKKAEFDSLVSPDDERIDEIMKYL